MRPERSKTLVCSLSELRAIYKPDLGDFKVGSKGCPAAWSLELCSVHVYKPNISQAVAITFACPQHL
jgi:hypothetical protein